MNRRSLILGAAAATVTLIAAPAIVRAESLMKIVAPRQLTVPEIVQAAIDRMARSRQVEFQAYQDLVVFGTSITEYDPDGYAVRAIDPFDGDLRIFIPNHRIEVVRSREQNDGFLIPGFRPGQRRRA